MAELKHMDEAKFRVACSRVAEFSPPSVATAIQSGESAKALAARVAATLDLPEITSCPEKIRKLLGAWLIARVEAGMAYVRMPGDPKDDEWRCETKTKRDEEYGEFARLRSAVRDYGIKLDRESFEYE